MEMQRSVTNVVGAARLARSARGTAMDLKKKGHITICELVKSLIVPPRKRTDEDCRSMAGALHAFVSSMDAWKDGFMKAAALAMARQAELKTVDANQTVFSQGEIGNGFYFV